MQSPSLSRPDRRRELVRHELEHGLRVIDAFRWVLHLEVLDDAELMVFAVNSLDATHARDVTVTETIVRPETRRQVLDAATHRVDLEYVDHTPSVRIRVELPADTDAVPALKLRNTDIELRLTLVGNYRDADGQLTSVRWTSHLTPRQHESRPYDKTSPTSCSLEMTGLTGLHHATSTYTYAPRFWTGLDVKISSVAMERILAQKTR